MTIAFNNELYLQKQTKNILERIDMFNNKLYLEFGGKLFDDYHASRVLPGFDANGKAKLLQKLKDKAEIIFCINAADIERNKIRADFGITYDLDVLRLIDNLRSWDICVSSVVITQFSGQPSANVFKQKLEMRGEKVYVHRHTKGYPTDVETIVSDEGYGANPYIETTRPLVVITAPGPGSGKLATCLSQLYHEYKRGVRAGYAKFETFPIWNMPLKHPVNLAYEAATADLRDVNMIDPFHLEAYGVTTVNYNRDIEVFPIVKTILRKITGDDTYKSPTDMGVNMAGYAILDDESVRKASKQEIVRRYFKSACDYKQGITPIETVNKVETIMKDLNLTSDYLDVVGPALAKAEASGSSAMAIKLRNGKIVTGRSTNILSAASAMILNSVKVLSDLSDDVHLISPIVLEPILKLKHDILGSKIPVLDIEDVLVALCICAATNPAAQLALSKLPELFGCEAHSSNMLTQTEESVFRKLKINLTCQPKFISKDLYYI